MSVTIKIVETGGLAKYKAHLASINKQVSNLEVPLREAGKIALALAKSYPPYDNSWRKGGISFTEFKPGSRYKRTRNLQRHWVGQLRKSSGTVSQYRVYNYGTIDPRGRPYFEYVQGDNQAKMHAGYWYTRGDMEAMLRQETIDIFEDFIKHIK